MKMKTIQCLIVFPILWVSLSAFIFTPIKPDPSTLKLVHVVFRHGNRNPDNGSILDDSPYKNESFYPEGYGQLTNEGKRTEHKIGVILRKRYDEFLGQTWNMNCLEARSTDVNRTKMSLALLLAGLYPPKGDQAWSELLWQPIPYNYYPVTQDKETQPWSACSVKFNKLLNEIYNTPEAVEYLKRYDELFAVLRNKTGFSSVDPGTAFNYYFGFATQQELGYPLEEWTKAIFPEPLHSATIDYYYFMTNTTAIRRIAAGYLIKKILDDSYAKIKGTLTPSSKKVFLYSAHEMNVAAIILTLDAYKLTDIPPYGSHVIFEVHQYLGVWGIQLFYQNYESDEPIPLKIPGCSYFCPIDWFSSLVDEINSKSDDDCID